MSAEARIAIVTAWSRALPTPYASPLTNKRHREADARQGREGEQVGPLEVRCQARAGEPHHEPGAAEHADRLADDSSHQHSPRRPVVQGIPDGHR